MLFDSISFLLLVETIASQAEHSDVIEILRKESVEPNQGTGDIKGILLLGKMANMSFHNFLINLFKNSLFSNLSHPTLVRNMLMWKQLFVEVLQNRCS